ncbi:hypothetical protein GCM10023075_57580 [Streptosporangium album]
MATGPATGRVPGMITEGLHVRDSVSRDWKGTGILSPPFVLLEESLVYPVAPPVPMRPIHGLARVAVAMLAIDSLVGVIAAVVSAQRAALIDRIIADPEAVDPTEVEASESLSATGVHAG